MGFVDYKGSIDESTKTAILDFIDQNNHVFSLGERMTESVRVKWYKVLLNFLNEVVKGNHKKSHRSGIKDF